MTPENLARAVAVFERTLVSPRTRFDRWIDGDEKALHPDEIVGFRLFTGKAQCSNCHSGWAFTDYAFHDIGLPGDDRGRGAVLRLEAAEHAFKTPSLREIGRSAPYMHDGSIKTLADVLRHYAGGIVVRPTLSAAFLGSGVVGRPLRLVLRARPAATGPIRVEIRRRGRLATEGEYASGASIHLDSRRVVEYRIALSTPAAPGYVPSRLVLRKIVFYPRLGLGSTGPSVLALNEALNRMHIALGSVDSSFGLDTRDAVVAFQKLHGLPRTGTVDARFWRVISASSAPRARYPGDHIEVSKPLQVLFVVRGGQVILVSHVSTGATGNTPVGRWHVYSKVPGWLPDGMFDSSFFLRGFAIHGYPTVPFYPGSHGCVRVPVWLAPRIYSYDPPGSTIYIY